MRYLRNKNDGFIYEWNEILADNPLCEEVSEQEAFPEKFVPKPQKGRKAALSLETADIPEEPFYTPPELAAEATRGLPT
jgi:hypothetical protein